MKKLKKLMYLLLIALLLSGTTVAITYLDTQNVEAAAKKGWTKTGKTFYYYKNNKKVKGWQTISKKTFYFDKKGKMVTGWQKLNGNYVYFKKTGTNGTKGKLLTGWQTIKGKTYYFKKAGTNGSKTQKLTGWQTIKGKTYYFNTGKGKTNGYAYVNGTFTIGKEKCTFDKNGVLTKRASISKPKVTPKPTKKPTPTPKPTVTPKPSVPMATGNGEVWGAVDFFTYWKTTREENGWTWTNQAKQTIATFNANMPKYQDMIDNYRNYTPAQMKKTGDEIRAMERKLTVEIEFTYYPAQSKAFVDAINEYRISKGVAPVAWNDTLSTTVRTEAGYNCYMYQQDKSILGCHAGNQISVEAPIGYVTPAEAISLWSKSGMHWPTMLDEDATHGAAAFYTCNDEYGGVWSNVVYSKGISTSVGYTHCPDEYRNLVLNCKTSSKTFY